jgi:transposase
LPKSEQKGATTASPRCIKDRFEERLFALRRHLFSSLDLVFFDTTSIYFEGEGGDTLGQHGHSKDHRPDLHQMVVGAILNEEGQPISCELWPGNTSDVTTLVPIARRLAQRFDIRQVCLVADRGMISSGTITILENEGWRYILGARMRNQKEVRDEVLAQTEAFQVVHPESKRRGDPSPLKVMEVETNGHRYIVCLNDAQARKDATDREAIVTALREQLKQGEKSLVGNKGYRRFLVANGATFSIDEEKIAEEARYDGKWVLRTNTDLPPAEVALRYKQLWMVEATFRSAKSLLTTRPVYHRQDETICGHVFCSFLALILRKALLDRLDRQGIQAEWNTILSDLSALQEVEIQQNDKSFLLRTEARGVAGKVFQAVGVALPPAVRVLTPASH